MKKEHPKEISIDFVLEQMPKSLALFLLSFSLGYIVSGILKELFPNSKSSITIFYHFLLQIKILPLNGSLGIFLNNWMAIVLSLILSILYIYKRRKKESKYTILLFLYFIPISITIINGFFMGAISFSVKGLMNKFMVFMPYGIFEVIAILLSSCLGLAFIYSLRPHLDEKDFDKRVRNILKSKTVVFYLIIISSLLIFSALMEFKVIKLVESGLYDLNFG